jgi:hypothetical protein
VHSTSFAMSHWSTTDSAWTVDLDCKAAIESQECHLSQELSSLKCQMSPLAFAIRLSHVSRMDVDSSQMKIVHAAKCLPVGVSPHRQKKHQKEGGLRE